MQQLVLDFTSSTILPRSEVYPNGLFNKPASEYLLAEVNYYLPWALEIIRQVPQIPDLYAEIYSGALDGAFLGNVSLGSQRSSILNLLTKHGLYSNLVDSTEPDPQMQEGIGVIVSYVRWLRDNPTMMHLGPALLPATELENITIGGGVIDNVSILDPYLASSIGDVGDKIDILAGAGRQSFVDYKRQQAKAVVSARQKLAAGSPTTQPNIFGLVNSITEEFGITIENAYERMSLNRFAVGRSIDDTALEVAVCFLLANRQSMTEGLPLIGMGTGEFEHLLSGLGDSGNKVSKWHVNLGKDGHQKPNYGVNFSTIIPAVAVKTWFVDHEKVSPKSVADLIDYLKETFKALIDDFTNRDQVSRTRLLSILRNLEALIKVRDLPQKIGLPVS